MELRYPQKSNGMYVLSHRDMDEIVIMVLRESMPSALERHGSVEIIALAEVNL